jgi:PAS domain S-box-containing protein
MSLQSALTGQEYALLVEQSPIMIWRAGIDGLCDFFNERWLAFTGRPLDQELGNGWAEGVHAEDLGACMATYQEAFGRHEIFEMEYRLRRADGTYRWILDRGVPLFAPDGGFLGYIGSCIDVTDRVEAQAAQIHMLHDLLPICMTCKKIRDDDGYWQNLEKYIRDHAGVKFSHGYCPDCARTFYEEQMSQIKEELSRETRG